MEPESHPERGISAASTISGHIERYFSVVSGHSQHPASPGMGISHLQSQVKSECLSLQLIRSDLKISDLSIPCCRLKITFIDKDGQESTFEVAEGDNLLDIAQSEDLEMEGNSTLLRPSDPHLSLY